LQQEGGKEIKKSYTITDQDLEASTREGWKLVEHDPKLVGEYYQALRDVDEHFRSQTCSPKESRRRRLRRVAHGWNWESNRNE